MPGSQSKEKIFYMFRSGTQETNRLTHKTIEINKVKQRYYVHNVLLIFTGCLKYPYGVQRRGRE